MVIFLTIILIAAITVFLIGVLFKEEILSVKERDPAARGYFQIILIYSGLHAIIAYRITHALWQARLQFLARWLAQLARFLTGIEIHPAARIGKRLFIDHGMGIVIGETAIVGDNVILFQGVTLGGTGKETGKRHPTLEDNIVVGTGAKVLGNITIGSNSYIGANSVVLRNVPPNSTVVGVPGHITKLDGRRTDPLSALEHGNVSDPIMQHMKDIIRRLKTLEDKDKSAGI